MFANRTIAGVRIPCVTFYIIAVMLIFVYWAYRRTSNTKDLLETKVSNHALLPGLDGWAVTHIILFGFIGFVYPGHYVQALAVSVAWEVFEHSFGSFIKSSGARAIGVLDADGNAVGCTDEEAGYWYGRNSDVLYNMVAYILASELGMKYWPPADGDNQVWPTAPKKLASAH